MKIVLILTLSMFVYGQDVSNPSAKPDLKNKPEYKVVSEFKALSEKHDSIVKLYKDRIGSLKGDKSNKGVDRVTAKDLLAEMKVELATIHAEQSKLLENKNISESDRVELKARLEASKVASDSKKTESEKKKTSVK